MIRRQSQQSIGNETPADSLNITKIHTVSNQSRFSPGVPSTFSFMITLPLSEKLRILSQQEGVTPFVVLVAAFQVLLSRYTGHENIALEFPIAGSGHVVTEEPCTKAFSLQTDLSGNPSFRELLRRVSEVTLGADTHQDFSFEVLEDTEQGFKGRFVYNTNVFDNVTIMRMQQHFQVLLENTVINPEPSIAELPLLTVEEQQLLVEWNSTKAIYANDLFIPDLFEKQVEQTPSEVAVVYEGERLTYQELNQRANQVAHHLQALGVGPQIHVGLYMERSIELIVGLLGILKAGGVFVPLDPAFPLGRLALILADTHISVLLTQGYLVKSLPEHASRRVCLDDDQETIGQALATNPDRRIEPENLAYIIYTSGSTGRSKGVMIHHGALVNAYRAWKEAYQLESSITSHLQMANFTFDVFLGDMVRALCSGGKLVLCPGELRLIPEQLFELMRREQVTCADFVPVVFRNLVQYLEETEQNLDFMQLLVVGSESWTGDDYQRFRQICGPQTRLINAYGLTEVTIDSLYFENITGEVSIGRFVPIGRPFANTTVYLLDRYLRPVPIGLPGELYLGGMGVALGYLNLPELTAEHFLPNPFSDKPGMRFYKTKDMARYLPDGTIEFLGRIDYQVKVRGFRIELGEIEAVLCQYPDVQAAVVLAREDSPGDKRLVAYIVPSPAKTVTISHLRMHLKQSLPDYMVPSAFVLLEAMPITLNGKVDRQALPVPGEFEQRETFVAPRNPIEEMLASILAHVLDLRWVGIHDNFFALGGHSLLATQVISRIRSTLNIELPLRYLFEASTVAELAEKCNSMPSSQEELQGMHLLRVSRESTLALSFAQQRLWFFDQLRPNSSFYNLSEAFRLIGPLNIAVIAQSCNEIVRRHEILRTTFTVLDGHTVQVIAPDLHLVLAIKDLGEMPEAECEQEISRLIEEEALRPFDLSRGPLLRATLLCLGKQDHVLLLTMHHIVSDGWSLGILYHELTTLYSAFSAGKSTPLPELDFQYADFAVSQRQWLQGGMLEAQLAYWKHQLADLPALLELPTDHPRPAVESFRGAMRSFFVPASVFEGLNAMSQREGVTLFMLLLAAFQILLWRYTQQEDIVVGSPIANRNHAVIEGLIGFFVNMLVLRTDLSGDPRFCDLLIRVREVALGAYAHQDMPFDKLVEELQPERNLSRQPLFQVMFVLQNAPVNALEFADVSLSPLKIENRRALCDLALLLEDTNQGLSAIFEYNRDLFEASTIDRMAEHFQVLLAAIVSDPKQHISQLPILTKQEQQQILMQWNATDVDYSSDRCIHEMFERQAARTPDRIAVTFGNGQLTYQELNQRANQVAHYLQRLSIGPRARVGICVERSLEMLVGILGILKAGNVYVPLDPAYPRERLAFIVQDTQVPLLLTQHRLLHELPEHQAQVICLDTDWEFFAHEAAINIEDKYTPDDLAYIIYTSGSTGQPKGVMVSHYAITNLLLWGREKTALNQVDRVLQIASFSFDISIWEFFVPHLVGAQVVLAEHEGYKDSAYLASFIAEQQITIAHFVPSLLKILVEETALKNCTSLRCILSGGEALTLELARRFFACLHDVPLHHIYGPTEAAIITTSWVCPQDRPMSIVPIGAPVANMQTYLLDKLFQPVPVGVLGEIYIGGDGLAWGYLHRPALTAERFIPNPFSHKSGARLYRTGDLARYLPTGEIEFVGRNDSQVKVRGYRIELGEIEAALGTHPSVRETVIMLREDTPGDKRLVAYVVPRPDYTCTSNDLRRFLQSMLPNYMVPSAFVFLNAFPLNPNGKIDRRALPLPDTTRSEFTAALVVPRSPIEEILVEIWSSALNYKQIGIYDNFFVLGGHSLLVTQVISRIRTVFQIELPLRSLFEAPTVAELAKKVEIALGAGQSLQRSPMLPVSREHDLPLSFAQQRLWFLDQMQPGNSFYNIPAVLRLQGSLNVGALEQSLQEIVQRHEALRTTFPQVAGNVIQSIVPVLTLPLVLVNLQDYPTGEREAVALHLAAEEAERPFDLAHGPLLRTTLLYLGDEKYILLLTIHHIIADGWSFSVLYRELSQLYEAFLREQASSLPKLGIQYADFAVWQRQWLQDGHLARQLAYWQQRLANAPILLELPTDHPRPAIETFRGAIQNFALSLSVSESLKVLSQREGVTLFMALLAAFEVLLLRYTGQEDLIVGSPIANRNHAEIEGLIGFFVNMLVLRTDMSGDPSFHVLLGRVREVALEAYAHQDVPFEKLVEELQPERNLGHSPLCQVVFVLQNAPELILKLADVDLQVVDIHNNTAKFDLIVSLSEEKEGLCGYFEYNTDLFEASTMKRMIEHFQMLLAGIVSDPEQRLSELPLLTEAERQQLLAEWDTHVYNLESPASQCIHQLFESQVERTPEAIAVVFENDRLTYQELNQRANQVAHYLRRLGVRAEMLIGLYLERSLDLVIGILGILKAGGAYVPLDATSPKERLAFLLEDAHIPILLTQKRLIAGLPEHQAKVVCLDTDVPTLENTTNPVCDVQAENVAYVIYTSGSTGRPKGVVVSHFNVARLFQTTHRWFNFDARDVWTLFHSSAFDFSVWELWGALLYGGRLVIVSYWDSRSPEVFYDLLYKEHVTVLNQTPSAFHSLIRTERLTKAVQPLSLRLIIFGGEALELTDLRPWLERYGDQVPQLVNMYGITETTVHVTYRPLTAKDISEASGSLIGRPCPDLQVYVLDRNLQLVPTGVPGELYIGGNGLARNYLYQPELTAERFIPHPFSREEGMRLYKTGDLVRYRHTGELEYLGRIDQQVKIRGFRIELGEIEAVLSQHPALQDAAVLVREDIPDDKRLVAYVVQDQHYQEGREHISEQYKHEWIEQWQTLYDETYSQPALSLDPAFNIVGWNSSYTDRPVPQEEMREWIDNTIERILALQPQHVLEIGCGTGLLLLRLASHCVHYSGTDLSAIALRSLQQYISQPQHELSQVTLMQCPADDFTGIPQETFDTIILNSVVQYFPSIDYLMLVLEKAVASVKPGGSIFIGDVRSFPLLEAFHTAVQLYQAPDSLLQFQLQQRIQRRMANEKELVIDPAFFTALMHHLPQISHVQIQQKRGRWHNELTQFRYDVVLHIGKEVPRYGEPLWLDWRHQRLTVNVIRHLLAGTQPELLCITNIPNARLMATIKAMELLSLHEKVNTVGELRKSVQNSMPMISVDPQELWKLGQELFYTVIVNAPFSQDGCYDVVFKRQATVNMEASKEIVPFFTKEPLLLKSWSNYGNTPLQSKVARELIPHLREYLQKKLPDYMLPADFVLLETMPLTPNGKLDRRALPAPNTIRPELEETFVAPRTPIEETLTKIFAQILGVERVGIHDNFFALGGHSLLATQVISRLRESFQVALPLRTLFEQSTVAGLAEELLKYESRQGQVAATARLLQKIEGMSAEEIRKLLQSRKRSGRE